MDKLWLESLPTKSLAVKLILKSDQANILLVKPNYKKGWQFPGGGVEKNEDPVQALVREIKEEINYVIDPAKLKLRGTAYRSDIDNVILVYEYLEVIPESLDIKIQLAELDDYRFIPPPKVAGMVSQYYLEICQKCL